MTDKHDPYYDPDMQNKLIKKAAYGKITLSVIYSLIVVFISYLASTLMVFAMIIPPILFPIIDTPVFAKVSDMIVYTAQMTLPAVFYIFLTKKRIAHLYHPCVYVYPRDEHERSTPQSILAYFVLAFSISHITATLSNIITVIVSYLGSHISPALVLDNAAYELPTPKNATEFLLDLIAVALLPAILEEFLFRGALLGEFLKYGKTFAIFMSAFLFASVHGSIDQMMYSFVYGLVFGFITVKTGSLTAGIIIHFLNNAYSCIADYLGNLYDTDLFWNILSAINLILISAGLAVLIYKILKHKFTYKEIPDEQKKPCELSEKEKFRIFVSPLMLLYYGFILFETLFIYISYNLMT